MRALLVILALPILLLPLKAAEMNGTYKGSWSGDSGGGDFIIIIDSRDSTHPRAEVSFTLSGEDIKGSVTSIRIEGSKIDLAYKFELDGMDLESVITGELQGRILKGSYKTKSLADGSEVDSGTWKTEQ